MDLIRYNYVKIRMFALPAEDPYIFGGKIVVEVIPILVKGLEVFRIVYPVLNDPGCVVFQAYMLLSKKISFMLVQGLF
jgi:hypothetical protein